MLDPARPLYENLRHTAEAAADRVALTFLDARLRPTRYTYAELFARVGEIARGLAAHGLQRGDTVGILLETQEGQTLHYLAALACGLIPAILTPPNRKLDREYYQQTTRAVIAYCRFEAVIGDRISLGPEVRVLRPLSLETVQPGQHGPAAAAVDAAFLQFSSGTTGIKRGVPVRDETVLRQLIAYGRAIDLSPDDCVVSWLPLYHDMGFIASLNLPLAYGAHAVMLHPLDWVANPGVYLRAVSELRGTLGWHPNFAYAFMAERVRNADLAEFDLSSLRGLVNCSEPVTYESQERFLRRFAPAGLRRDIFWGCYAMAETTFALTHGHSGDAGYLDGEGPCAPLAPLSRRPFVAVGRPLPGVSLQVTDESGQPCSDRHVGELWVRSPFNVAGYYNNPEVTAAAFRDRWYRTGDLGYQVGDDLFVCGRKKDILIIGGVNIHPEDLEDLAAATPGIHPGRVAAFAEFDAEWQTQRAILLAEPEPGGEGRAALVLAIRQRVLAELQISNFEVHMVPEGWLVKSSAGKIARSANREKWRHFLPDSG